MCRKKETHQTENVTTSSIKNTRHSNKYAIKLLDCDDQLIISELLLDKNCNVGLILLRYAFLRIAYLHIRKLYNCS
jgi:hypothetical protein